MKNRREFLGVMLPLTLSPWALNLSSLKAQETVVEPMSDFGFETLFLTWSSDPLTSMRVQWIQRKDQKPDSYSLLYRSSVSEEWKKQKSTSHPFGSVNHWVNRVDLQGLRPGMVYEFRMDGNLEIWKFRTAPEKLTEALTFAEGGDVGTNPKSVIPLHQMAASWDPLFGFVGGDLSYSNAKDIHTEIRYWKQWNAHMRAHGNRLIPMVTAIGNHEVQGGFGKTKAEAPFFYALFDGLFSQSGAYGTLDFGDYLSLIILDSGHTAQVAEQKEWLKKSLTQRSAIKHRFVAYHVPAYPSVRKMEEKISQEIREHWVPVMEAEKVRVVFEHHDHAFKRTKKLLNGKENSEGIIYCGDGAWGRDPRPLRSTETEYFKITASSLNVWKVTLTADNSQFWAGNEKGERLDSFEVVV